MSKHTPGPWWTSGLEVGTEPIMQVKIAKVSGSNYGEACANARLIAAAPDLLAALQNLITRCDGEEGVRADGSNIDTRAAHALLEKVAP